MKIGFKRGDHWYSYLTRLFLCSEWSHGAVEINGRIYESTARKGHQPKAGVRDYSITDELAADYVWIDIGTEGDRDALAAYEQIRGHGYDFFSLLAFLPFIRARDSRCEYCYEVQALMLGMSITSRVTPEIILFHLLKT